MPIYKQLKASEYSEDRKRAEEERKISEIARTKNIPFKEAEKLYNDKTLWKYM